MSKEHSQGEKLTDEFRILGKNLADAARAAWDNPERQRLQSEIERGLSEMRESLVDEYEHFRASPTARKVKEDVENLGNHILDSETETKIRSELISALRQMNQELENLATQLRTSGEREAGAGQESEPATTEEVAEDMDSAADATDEEEITGSPAEEV